MDKQEIIQELQNEIQDLKKENDNLKKLIIQNTNQIQTQESWIYHLTKENKIQKNWIKLKKEFGNNNNA